MLKRFLTSHGFLFQTIKLQARVSCVLLTLCPLHYPIKTLITDSQQEFILNEVDGAPPSTTPFDDRGPSSGEYIEQFDQSSSVKTCTVGISHPWPEWVRLMEHFCKVGCFEEVGIRFYKGELDPKNVNRIRTACLKFARDRVDLIRYFSSKDIRVLAGSGCPVVDRKVVNSGKRLRALAGIDEAHVCGSCNLRGNCERAYVKAREGECGTTADVMRLLLTYGLNLVTGPVVSKYCLNKTIEETARRMLTEIVEHSTHELNSSVQESSYYYYQRQRHINVVSMTQRTIPDRLRIAEEDHDRHLTLKKGDWICDKCNFFNFGKNTRCLTCNENPPKRRLNHGEWECDSCNYINFRRNNACMKCDHRRKKSVVLRIQ